MSSSSPSGSYPQPSSAAGPGIAETAAQVVTNTISQEIVQLYQRTFGRGPTKARSFVQPQFAVCVMRDVFTPAEQTLIENGGTEEVEAFRARINGALDDQFVAIVEKQTGRAVQNHLPHLRVPADLAVHVFLFFDEA